MASVVKLLCQETNRYLRSRRMIAVVLLCALAAYLAVNDLERATFGTGLRPSAWDVHATALNNFMYVGYLVLVAYVALIGDTLVQDRRSGFARVVLPRVGGHLRWWTGKLASLVLAALMVHVLLLALCLACGWLKGGWSFSTVASSYASAASGAGLDGDTGQGADLIRLFAAVDPATNMAWREIARLLYEALAFSAAGFVLVALTVKVPKAVLPIALALLGAVADFILSRHLTMWKVISPGRRLLESIHSSWQGAQGASWSWSIAYWVAILFAGAVLGGWVLRRTDL